MTLVRCGACGWANADDARACATCGTLIDAGAPPTRPRAGVGVAHSAPAWAQVGGVVRLFLVLVGIAAATLIAAQVGAPEATLDVVVTGVYALLAGFCVFAAWPTVGPLLQRTAGRLGVVSALLTGATLFAFGAIYFPAVEWLGFPLVPVTEHLVTAGWSVPAIFLSCSLAPAVSEEIIFRGYVMDRLGRLLTDTEVLVVQAALFSILHLGVVIFPSHFVIGLLLGGLRRRTDSLVPGIAVHAAWNAFVVVAELTAPL